MRSSSNFDRVLERRRNYRESKFFPSSQVQGDGLTYYEDLVARNGERFDPSRAQQSTANQPAFSDLQQAVSAINQLNRALLTPALTLMVNPETLTITYGKKQVYTDRNRFNYIFQSWGEEQPRLSITGKSAGFVVGSRDGRISDFGSTGFGTQETASVSGYQYASKWDSAAWQNLMTLFAFYRNNGYIYDTAGRPKSEAHLFIGNVEISYDQWVYIGNFENFQYSYEETKQHGAVEFSFEFVVSFMYDRGQQQSVVRPWPGVTPSPGTLPPTTPAPPPLPGARTTREQETPNLAGGSTALLSDGIDPFAPRTGPGSGPFGLPPGSVPFF